MAAGLILSTNPQTLTAPITFTGTAVYGPAGTAWAVTNQTSIAGTGPDTPPSKGIGIELASGGTVTNQVGASFVGFDYGVQILAAAGTVANSGTITGTQNDGVNLVGGSVSNAAGATISGGGSGSAIDDSGNVTVTNLGTLSGPGFSGVYVQNGIGIVTNGASSATTATISGNLDGVTVGSGSGGAGTVTNFGTISAGGAVGDFGVHEIKGGSVTNGASGSTAALITGNVGVRIDSVGTVTNFATITGTANDGVNLTQGGSVSNAAGATISGSGSGSAIDAAGNVTVTNLGTLSGPGFSGVYVQNGIGIVTNGASSATTATISGNLDGVTVGSGSGGAGTVSNFGTISAGGAVGDFGVREKSGGSVTNGASGSTAALITGNVGVRIDSVGTVTNFATITGTANDGVNLTQGGSVSNAAGATISGSGSGSAIDAAGNVTVTNLGTLSGPGFSGVYVQNGIGIVTNGASSATTATISGNLDGVTVGSGSGGAGTVSNFGTISAGGAVGDFGVREKSGGSVTNGASGSTAALITGNVGVQIDSVGTVTNFATITGTGGTALNFTSAGANRLIDEPGAKFLGAGGSAGTVNGGGGASTLELAGTAPGTVNGIGTTFANFQTVEVDSGALWTSGVVAAIGGNTLQLDGPGSAFTDTSGLTLASGGKITGQGKVTGGITGPGAVVASGGTLELATAISASDNTAFQIANSAGSELLLDAAPGSGNTFGFLGANGDLALANDSGFTDTISGLNVGSSGVKTNFVDIKGHAVTIVGISGQGSTSGAISLSDGAVLNLVNLSSSSWVANTVADGNGGTDVFVSAAPPNPPPPAGTTADLILRDTTGAHAGQLDVFDIGNNAISAVDALGNVGLSWQTMGIGAFAGNPNEADLLMRDGNTANIDYFDIQHNQIVAAGPMGSVGLEWKALGVGDFSGNANETDMIMRDSNTGNIDYFDIQHNQFVAAGSMGNIGTEEQALGVGDFSGNAGEADMLMRDSNTGNIDYFDIQHNQFVAVGPMGSVGLEWQALGVGNFSGNANESDLIMRDTQNGAISVFDIQHNQFVGVHSMGTIGAEWEALGFGDFSGNPGESDLIMRDTQNGVIDVFDIQHNQFVGVHSMSTVGVEWQNLGVGSPLVPGSPLI